MLPSYSGVRTAFATLGFVCVAATAGCDIVDPCILKAGTPNLEGSWALVKVNGQPLPSGGYPIPNSDFSIDYLKAGILRFRMTEVTGDCGDKNPGQKGRVTASYDLRASGGSSKPSEVYGGSYTYDPSSGRVTLSALGRSAEGARILDELNITATVSGFSAQLGFRFISE